MKRETELLIERKREMREAWLVQGEKRERIPSSSTATPP
jgi:hypothetical protein